VGRKVVRHQDGDAVLGIVLASLVCLVDLVAVVLADKDRPDRQAGDGGQIRRRQPERVGAVHRSSRWRYLVPRLHADEGTA
jgi:hypothetical protein